MSRLETLDVGDSEALNAGGLSRLYSHQSEAFESIRRGQDTVLVSKTASGKTLSFLLPILDDYLKTDAVFWKKEQTESGSRWIQSTKNDQQRAEMWQAKDA